MIPLGNEENILSEYIFFSFCSLLAFWFGSVLFLSPSLFLMFSCNFPSCSRAPLSHVSRVCLSVQWVQITSVMRKQSFPARQTTAVSLSGPAVMAPMTASTTATRKAAVSACVSADVMLCEGKVLTKVQDQDSKILCVAVFVFQNVYWGCVEILLIWKQHYDF